jgi:integrase
MTFQRALTRWYVFARMGKAATTQHFYREIVKMLRRRCRHALKWPVTDLTEDNLRSLSTKFGNYSVSRWNGAVQCLRWITPAANALKKRKSKLTRKPPPSRNQFKQLLVECDQLKRSKAGLVIDFLGHTGLRITAARNVRWEDVHDTHIEYVAKGGRRCAVPIINGFADTLKRLREVDEGKGYVLPRKGIRRGLAKACAAAGVRRLSHHDFRHMFTTRCLESGVDVGTVAQWRGDSDGGAMLIKRYFHLMTEHSLTMAKKVRI